MSRAPALVILGVGAGLGLAACGGGDGDAPDAGSDSGSVGGPAYLYVANYDDGSISAFAVDEGDGALTAVPGSPFAAPDLGFTLAYADPGRIFLPTGLADGTSNGIHSLVIDWDSGALTAAPGSPFPASRPEGSYGVAATPSGSHIFVNEPDVAGTVAAYAVGANGALTDVQDSPFGADGNLARNVVTPSGQFLYVAAAQRNRVFGFRITAGSLTPVPQVSVVTGPDTGDFSANPQDLVVHPGGAYLYVGNFAAGDVAAFSIDAGTGDLTEIAGSPFTTAMGTCGLGFARQGDYLYAGIGGTQAGNEGLHAFAIAPATGALTPVAGSPFTVASARVCGIVAHPAADRLYAVEGGVGSGTVHVLTVDPATGAVTDQASLATTTPAGSSTAVMAVQPD